MVEPTWNFAALTETSPVVFRVPNRENAVVHISGRSANVHDRECSYELSPLTRWTIGGAAADKDVPDGSNFRIELARARDMRGERYRVPQSGEHSNDLCRKFDAALLERTAPATTMIVLRRC